MNYEILFKGKVVGEATGAGWVIRLENGHEMIGFLLKRDRELKSGIGIGTLVHLEANPFDLSKGRIIEIFNELKRR